MAFCDGRSSRLIYSIKVNHLPLPEKLLPWFPKVPQTGHGKNRNLRSHSSRGWESEIKVEAGLVPLRLGGGSALCLSPDFWRFAGNLHFLGLKHNHPSHCLSLTWHSPCVSFSLCVPISPFNKVYIVKAIHWRRKRQPTPAFLLESPRDGGAWGAAVYEVARVGHDWSDLAAVAAAWYF